MLSAFSTGFFLAAIEADRRNYAGSLLGTDVFNYLDPVIDAERRVNKNGHTAENVSYCFLRRKGECQPSDPESSH